MFAPWHLDLIAALRVARLATIAADGRPHLVPACYAFVEGRFAIPVDEKPKRSTELARLRNIRRDPRVTLLFDRYDDDWTRLAWVRVEGSGEVLARGDQWPNALVALRERYPQYKAMDLEALPLMTLTPERTLGWRWSRVPSG